MTTSPTCTSAGTPGAPDIGQLHREISRAGLPRQLRHRLRLPAALQGPGRAARRPGAAQGPPHHQLDPARPRHPGRRRAGQSQRRSGPTARTWTPWPATSTGVRQDAHRPARRAARRLDRRRPAPATSRTCAPSSPGSNATTHAVLNGLTLPYSSGKVEGNVNRIKMPQDGKCIGRARFDLLRKRCPAGMTTAETITTMWGRTR